MLTQYEAAFLAAIDDLVADGSDDDLFASGYLRGHITLAVAQADMQNDADLVSLDNLVQESVQQAISAGELSPPDQVLVRAMWQQLLAKVKAQAIS